MDKTSIIFILIDYSVIDLYVMEYFDCITDCNKNQRELFK